MTTDADAEAETADAPEAIAPVPVAVGHDLNVQGQAADYGGFTCYRLAGNEAAQPILPYDPSRHRAQIAVTVPPAQNQAAFGTQTSPAAGAVIASAVLAAGTYTITGTVSLSGTVGAADTNNFAYFIGAQQLGVQLNPGAAGVYPSPAAVLVIPAGGATLAIKAIGAGTVGSVYTAEFLYAPGAPGTELVYVGTLAQCQQKLGGIIVPGHVWVIENNQQLFMAPDGINAVSVTVLAERWDSSTPP